MKENFLSQQEVDALLNKKAAADETGLGDTDKDVIGEVGNITMSTAATTLSSILNRQVLITTPRVEYISFKQIIKECDVPKVVSRIEFKQGLKGNNLLMMNVHDSSIIADLMMGGDGLNVKDQLTELELSAVSEAMNQMIGSASTSMAQMLGKSIDIEPPEMEVWDNKEEIDYTKFVQEDFICKIAFRLSVEGLIESEIMQLYTLDTVKEIVAIMMGEAAPEPKAKPAPEPTAQAPSAPSQMDNGNQSNQMNQSHQPNQMSQNNQPNQMNKSGQSDQVSYEGDFRNNPSNLREEEVNVSKPIFSNLEDQAQPGKKRNLDLIMDVPLEFSVVLGKTKKTIQDVLALGSGSVIELNKLADEPLEVYVNGKLIAHGEVVVINENFGIRITHIMSKEERVNGLK